MCVRLLLIHVIAREGRNTLSRAFPHSAKIADLHPRRSLDRPKHRQALCSLVQGRKSWMLARHCSLRYITHLSLRLVDAGSTVYLTEPCCEGQGARYLSLLLGFSPWGPFDVVARFSVWEGCWEGWDIYLFPSPESGGEEGGWSCDARTSAILEIEGW